MKIYRIAQITQTAQTEKEPWEMTKTEFLDHHYTGSIPDDAYEGYKTVQGFNWIKKENYPELYSVKDFGGNIVEFRKSGKTLQYVKKDKNDEIVRDETGSATYLSLEEMKAKGLATNDQSVVAFVGDDAIGFASNEWGATGVWVAEEYQRLGIGTYLLNDFRKTMPKHSKIGQMTNSGVKMTLKHHKDLVQEALKQGKNVPQEVLANYPDLENLNQS